MEVAKLLKRALKQIEILDAELLLAFVLGKTREYIKAHPEEDVSFFSKLKFCYYLKQRKKGMPLAYITGKKEFYGMEFLVTKNVLVPRPETEVLVDKVVKKIQDLLKAENDRIILLDIGTGTGCIPISIANTLKEVNKSKIDILATDISKPALSVAGQNVKRHGIDIEFLLGDLMKPFLDKLKNLKSCQLVITANLPYLTASQFEKEKSIQFEPKTALVADKQGLGLYEELIVQIKSLNIKLFCFFEIDSVQKERILKMIDYHFPQSEARIVKDLAGKDRVVCIAT